jgi:hypothetical protein
VAKETEIIRSEGTHEVSFVEGTNSAASRKSTPQSEEARKIGGDRFEGGPKDTTPGDRYASGAAGENPEDRYEGRGWDSIQDRLEGAGDAGGIQDRLAGGDSKGIQDRLAGGSSEGIQDRLAGGGSDGIQDRLAGGGSEGIQDRLAGGDSKGIQDRLAGGGSEGIQDRLAGGGSEGIQDRFAGGALPGGASDRFVPLDQALVNRNRLVLEPLAEKPKKTHRLYEVLAKVPKPVFQAVELFKDGEGLNTRLTGIRERTDEIRKGMALEVRSSADSKSTGKDSKWPMKKKLPKL